MHELGVVFHVIDQLQDLAAQNNVSHINSVTLQIGTVTGISGNRYTVTVLEDNAQYDKDDVVYVTYLPAEGGVSLKAGDIINAHYNYITDVSSVGGIPHITTDSVSILPDYTPPETTVEATVETTVATTESPVEITEQTTEATE